MQLPELIEITIAGMGYDLVKFTRASGGLLCVYIDLIYNDSVEESFITLEDCEKVTHQLLHVLTVEDIAYERLEVSSPGLDRPLRKFTDYVRFCGREAVVKLHIPAQASVPQKSFRGVLLRPDGENLKIEFETKYGPAVLDFVLSDVEKAYLVPKVNFRSGKR